MARSATLRASDFDFARLLAYECREGGDNPSGWREHWFEVAAKHVGADFGTWGEIKGIMQGRPQDLGTCGWGVEQGFDKAGWEAALAVFKQTPELVFFSKYCFVYQKFYL